MLWSEWILKTLCKGKEVRHNIVWFHLYGISRIGRSVEKESRSVVAWGREKGANVEWLLNVYRISFLGEENVLKLDSGDGHPKLWVYQMSLLVNFMLYIFYNNKKKGIRSFLWAAADRCHAGCSCPEWGKSEIQAMPCHTSCDPWSPYKVDALFWLTHSLHMG